MNKSNPLNTSARQVSSPSNATPTPSKSPAQTGHSEPGKPNAKLNSKNKLPGVTPLVESDGYGVRNYPEIQDDPLDDDDARASAEAWDRRFAVIQQEYDKLNAKMHAREASKKFYVDTDMPNSTEVTVARSKNSSTTKKPPQTKPGAGSSLASDEPRLRGRERSSTVSETVRGGLQRIVRASMTTADFEVASMADLVNGSWISGKPIKQDAEGFPLLDKVPPKIREALHMEYVKFTDREPSARMSADERENELKKILSKRFLSMTVFNEDSDFDQSKIGSLIAINRYLSNMFDFKIEPPDSSASTEPATSGASQPDSDFIDLLVLDAVSRSRNYRVNWSVDLGEVIKTDSHAKTAFTNTIAAAMVEEKVEKLRGQRIDVSGTLVRDFPHSAYEMEAGDGSKKKINSIDEFVAFVGDPQKKGLPLQVSHFTSQNLGIFIKNLMFSKTDATGTPQTVLKLSDGTPVGITVSPKASFRLKKTADGSVEIHYHSSVDTKGALAAGKNTARVWDSKSKDWRPVVIEDAIATVDCSILVHPDGTATMGMLRFNAEGWNNAN